MGELSECGDFPALGLGFLFLVCPIHEYHFQIGASKNRTGSLMVTVVPTPISLSRLMCPGVRHNLAHEHHAQTGAAHLGGEIRFKDLGDDLRGHTFARILNHQGGMVLIQGRGEANLSLEAVASRELRTRWAMATFRRCLFSLA